MDANIAMAAPEELMKNWMAFGGQASEQFIEDDDRGLGRSLRGPQERTMRTLIFAPATAPGRAAIAVIRISGPEAGSAPRALAGRLPAPRPERRCVGCGGCIEGETIDEALTLWFPGPHSYTGEDVAEVQVHRRRGGRRCMG